ncbi:prepilin-type N-terminal cleavage/methylation domain-containing protein [Pseudomonas sp. CFBP 8770]|uniref:pilin n=1 Tax=unclassified Pseudomonas TaxID=196821 RepID=UPI00177E6488|nr:MULTISPECIES: prepilin-type N-terminal cleavage/methylation domain-containing protein [unclassified Pseudomonas]MBD8474360.1 prepilin-type N-terminal cleavage/methylation domain-containing protein [Pseudomonas sp. CFBP 8773]MBD8647489.1 prepilin-type N-terminal cleavage/methylation domain-containing protein [Pseudomonas sp. CFBP 8770]
MDRSRSHGFTLIEMMIAVAIVGILSFLAVYMFQTYSNRAKLANGVSELRSLVGRYDALHLSGNASPNLTDLEVTDSSRCHFSIGITATSDVAVMCELLNVYGALEGGILTYRRSTQGQWVCTASSGIAPDILPAHCR